MKPMKRLAYLLAPLALVVACDNGPEDDSGDETSGEGSTTSSSTTGTSSADTTSGSTTSDGPTISQCDVWAADDCMEGFKCMPYDEVPVTDMWDANGCFPVAAEVGQPGDDCTVYDSAVDGMDDCSAGAMCMPADFEDLSQGGTCVAFCTGSSDAPGCEDPSQTCIIANDGVLNLCLSMCDPVMQDCAPGEGCYLNPTDNKFFCFPQDEAAAEVPSNFADACGTLNFCDPGLQCDEARKVPGCETEEYCCTEFCDLTEANADEQCSGYEGGQRCLPHFGDGQAPSGFDHIGWCAIPE